MLTMSTSAPHLLTFTLHPSFVRFVRLLGTAAAQSGTLDPKPAALPPAAALMLAQLPSMSQSQPGGWRAASTSALQTTGTPSA
jgi:hypothetical protein